ncbi:MAG: hypothetical protein VXW74_02445, partial [Candidatus Thermoplasmatota archaeon]|nr:hypothetical protein [Candidatus Thermoplasmatota archaeon]
MELLDDARELAAYKPLARMNVEDPIDTRYWHRFPCGRLAVLCNPFQPMCKVLDLPPLLPDGERITDLLTSSTMMLMHAINPPAIHHSMVVIEARWIPLQVRRICLVLAKINFGITDDLVVASGSLFGDDSCGDPRGIVREMCEVHKLVKEFGGRPRMRPHVLNKLMGVIERSSEPIDWRTWMLHSMIVYSMVEDLDDVSLSRLGRRHPSLFTVAALLFMQRLNTGFDGQEYLRRAHIVASEGTPTERADDPIRELRKMMTEREAAREEYVRDLLTETVPFDV